MGTATLTSNPTLRRLMKEAHELSADSSSPSPYFHAHPVSDSDIFDWHFTIAGPPAPSPYAGGIYHGRIVLPRQYPLRPPSFRFLTPSGRFEVNREICLSISGHHEETWQPAWGIRTALIALRSLMDGDAQGQVGGVEAKEEVRKEWARRSRGWKCDVCSGGKTNEEVLNEWRETCRKKGVGVEEGEQGASQVGDGSDSAPDGLRMGYKDDQGRVGDIEQTTHDYSTQDSHDSGPTGSSLTQLPSQQQQPLIRRQSGTAPYNSSGTSLSGIAAPSASSTAAAGVPPVPTQPTRTNPEAGAEARTTQIQRRVSEDSIGWMDRAIAGIAMALILMVLRSWVLPNVP